MCFVIFSIYYAYHVSQSIWWNKLLYIIHKKISFYSFIQSKRRTDYSIPWENQAITSYVKKSGCSIILKRQRYSTIHKKIKLFHHPKRGQAFPSSPKKNQTLPSSKIKSGYSIIQNKFKLSNHPNKTSGYSIIPKIRLSQHPKENYEEIRLGNSQH